MIFTIHSEGNKSTITWNPHTTSLEWWTGDTIIENKLSYLRWTVGGAGNVCISASIWNTALNAYLVQPGPGSLRDELKNHLQQLSQQAGISFRTAETAGSGYDFDAFGTGPRKADGTPDMRYKANWKFRK